MKVSDKDRQKIEEAHGMIMDMAQKYGMSMRDLIDECCGEGEEEGEESEMEGEDEPSPAEKPKVDKTKIAFIVGKLRGGHRGE